MRLTLSHVYNHLELQIALSKFITQAYNNFTKNGLDNITPQRVHARLSTLKDDWECFSLEHKAITIAIYELKEEDKVEVHNHSYFTKNLFTTTHEYYVEVVEKLTSLMEQDSMSIPGTSSQTSTLASSGMPAFFHHARFPCLDLPKFDAPSDWLSFKDLSDSLVITNPTLTAVILQL